MSKKTMKLILLVAYIAISWSAAFTVGFTWGLWYGVLTYLGFGVSMTLLSWAVKGAKQ